LHKVFHKSNVPFISYLTFPYQNLHCTCRIPQSHQLTSTNIVTGSTYNLTKHAHAYNAMPPAARYLSTPDLSCSSITKIRIVLVFSPAPFDIPERPEQTASHSRRLQTGPGRYPTFEHEHRAFVGQTCTLARSSSSRKPLSAADEILRSYTHEVLITCRVEVVPAP
jgi:hypothetical protein